MSGGEEVGELFKLGVVIAVVLTVGVMGFMMFSASGPAEAVKIFGTAFPVLILAVVPTSPFGAILTVFMTTIGTVVTLSATSKPGIAVVVSGFCWTLTNILMNIILGV